jgi:hypothetical protein
MPSSRIRAEVQVDNHVIVPRGRKLVRIEALALIHNDSDEHVVLSAPDSASAHGWQILDAKGAEVARHTSGKVKKVRGVTDPHCSTLVPSNHSVHELETMEVAAAKLKDGARYTLRHNHWGHVGEAEFVVVHEPERAAAPKKKAARRAPAKKKAAGKKPAGRKTASKKAGKAAGKKAPGKKAAGKKTAGKR